MQEAPEKRGGTWLRVIVALFVSVGLIAWVLGQVDPGRLVARASEARPLPILVAFGCSLAVLLLRAQRFHALAERSSYGVTIAAVAVQNFLVRVTPFRVGELGLPVVLARYAGEPLMRSVVNVLLVRLVELWMLLLLGVSATAAWLGPTNLRGGAALALLGVVTLAVLTFRRWLGGLARLVGRAAPATASGLRGRIGRAFERVEGVLADGARLTLGARLRLGLGTLCIAVFQYSMFWALLATFGVRVTPLQVLVGGTAAQFAAAAPVPSVGSLGPLEAAWAAGFSFVGVAPDDAVLTAVGCQVITLAFAAFFAALAWFGLPARGPGQNKGFGDNAGAAENNGAGGDA